MKKLVIVICILLAASCDRSLLSPESLGSDVVIQFRGWDVEQNGAAVFLVYNGREASVYYMGSGPGSPIYTTQTKNDTGWVGIGPGWCGTGLALQELPPDESFKFSAHLNDEYENWRLGIWIYDAVGELDGIVWSGAVR